MTVSRDGGLATLRVPWETRCTSEFSRVSTHAAQESGDEGDVSVYGRGMCHGRAQGCLRLSQAIKQADTYHLATVAGDQPHVCPFGTIDLFEGGFYLHMGKGKDVFQQIVANPTVEIEARQGADWLRVSSGLTVDGRVEAKRHMLDAYPNLCGMYDENDPNAAVLCFRHGTTPLASLVCIPGWSVAW